MIKFYGEPEVVHVDQEDDYEITILSNNFEEFLKGLVSEEQYDTFEEYKEEAGGYAPSFITAWLDQRIQEGLERSRGQKYKFSFADTTLL